VQPSHRKEEPEGVPETFSDAARRAIQIALEACDGRVYGKDGAAARLNIKPTTLQGKMKKLGMTRKGQS